MMNDMMMRPMPQRVREMMAQQQAPQHPFPHPNMGGQPQMPHQSFAQQQAPQSLADMFRARASGLQGQQPPRLAQLLSGLFG